MEAGADKVPNYVSSWAKLAELLGVSRQNINNWKKMDGFPARKPDGRIPVQEVRAWMEKMDGNGILAPDGFGNKDINELRAEKIHWDIRRAKQAYDREAETLIESAKVKEDIETQIT